MRHVTTRQVLLLSAPWMAIPVPHPWGLTHDPDSAFHRSLPNKNTPESNLSGVLSIFTDVGCRSPIFRRGQVQQPVPICHLYPIYIPGVELLQIDLIPLRDHLFDIRR